MANALSGGDKFPVVTSFVFQPSSLIIPVGEVGSFVVTVIDQDSANITNIPGVAVSSNPTVANVFSFQPTSSNGQATLLANGISVGTTNLLCIFDGKQSSTAVLTVSGASTDISIPVTWTLNGAPFANQSLDYWVVSSTDELIISGTTTTNINGVLTITMPASYSGQKVLVVVNNLDSSMNTAGKRHSQRVVQLP
jgi:hypothetical protein